MHAAALALLALAAATAATQPRIWSEDDTLVLSSPSAVEVRGEQVNVMGNLHYTAADGSMQAVQDLQPAIASLASTVADNKAAAADALAAAATSTEGLVSTVSAAIGTAKTELGGRIDGVASDVAAQAAWRATYFTAGEGGLEIGDGVENGRLGLVADEIDLRGAVQIEDGSGMLVNINGVPDKVQSLEAALASAEKEVATLREIRQVLQDLGSKCNPLTQWEEMPYTPTSSRVCKPLTECVDGEFQERPATPTSDRTCSPHAECEAGMFEAEHPTPYHDRVCKFWSDCGANEYEVAPPTAFEDRTCAKKVTCDPDTTFRLEHADGGAAICVKLHQCTQYEDEIVAPTATTDRVCRVKVVECTATEYESAAPTLFRPRVCTAVTSCSSTEFQTAAPTATSDRVCKKLTTCQADEYQTAAPTATSDRVCKDLTKCVGDEREVTAPTATSDRVCLDVSLEGCDPRYAQYKHKVNDKYWLCMESLESSKTWDQISRVCNTAGGWRMPSARVMTHIGKPTDDEWGPARNYMYNSGSRYFICGQATRSCTWDSYKTGYNCNGLGYFYGSYTSVAQDPNWDAAVDGNFQEGRTWPAAQTASYGGVLATLCAAGGDVPNVEDWADGRIWK